MAPDDAVHLAIVFTTVSQDLVDAFWDVQSWDSVLDGRMRGRGVVPPVFAAAEIELFGISSVSGTLSERENGAGFNMSPGLSKLLKYSGVLIA